MAVKIFKGDATSDGHPADEMKVTENLGQHENLVGLIGRLTNGPTGLVLPLISTDYKVLGGPPSFESVTRDTFANNIRFTIDKVRRVLLGISAAAAHLHERHICHGDLYAHNILVNEKGHCYLTDYGAAFVYAGMDEHACAAIMAAEVRAFGCLVEDLVSRMDVESLFLKKLQRECTAFGERPSFAEIHMALYRESI